MTTRLGPEQQSRDWPYYTDLDGFLADLRADVSDHTDTQMRVEMFMMTPVAKAMAADLHSLPDGSQAAFRYLFARVALDEGLLELVGEEICPD